jgi:hypothetical protein
MLLKQQGSSEQFSHQNTSRKICKNRSVNLKQKKRFSQTCKTACCLVLTGKPLIARITKTDNTPIRLHHNITRGVPDNGLECSQRMERSRNCLVVYVMWYTDRFGACANNVVSSITDRQMSRRININKICQAVSRYDKARAVQPMEYRD